jgi:hypothetical protein
MTSADRALLDIDWSRPPSPVDDGAARDLPGTPIPDIPLTVRTDRLYRSRASAAGRSYIPIR